MSQNSHSHLRHSAQEHAALLPPLLAEAQHLAASVVMGTHGRRQSGQGEEFWQFRNAAPGDAWRSIDWRRSGRSDTQYVRQLEWQAAQSVLFWIDDGLSMGFTGDKSRPSKGARAAVLGLASAILLTRAGERVGLIEDTEPPRTGQTQIDRLSAQLALRQPQSDYGVPSPRMLPKGSRAVFLSDFLGEIDPLVTTLSKAADRGVTGAVVQILDPVEESFPFDGRTEFQSMSGLLRFETLRARGLRATYLDKLAARKAEVQAICGRIGWHYLCHHSSEPAQPALMWLYAALEQER